MIKFVKTNKLWNLSGTRIKINRTNKNTVLILMIPKTFFKDENSKIAHDLRKDYGEDRWKIIGKTYDSIVSVIYTVRNKVIRIISARKASINERDEYNNK